MTESENPAFDGEVFQPEGSSNLDEALEREVSEALGDASLDDLMQDTPSPAHLANQDGTLTAKVLDMHEGFIFLQLADRREGIMPVTAFRGEDLPDVGAEIPVIIDRYDAAEGVWFLTRKGAVSEAGWDTLEVGDVVEGRVTGSNKGGLELRVNNIRAFMPISQVDTARIEDLVPFLNQRMRCQVTEVDVKKKNLVVSRRKLLEAEAAVQAEKTLAEIAEGQTVPGTVKSLMPYGAFVDIGGVDGLLHVKDMSHGRVEHPKDLLSVGQELTVKILKIDRDRDRISLGLKQIQADPWDGVAYRYAADDILTGRVTRLADFGAFVEIEPGVEGLVPISEMSFQRRVNHPSEVCQVDETVQVRVLNVEPDRKRISLSIKQVQGDPWEGASVRWPEQSIAEGNVKRITDFGAFVELAPGVEGLVHISECGDGFVRSVGDAVQEGQFVKVKVLSVDEEKRRMSLSIKQASEPSPADYEQFAPPPDKPQQRRRRKKPLKGGLEGDGGPLIDW